MYKVVISLHECNEHGEYINKPFLYEEHGKPCSTIKEAFYDMDVDSLFEKYLEPNQLRE